MRIFVATGIFHPEPGGPATYLHRLLPAVQARGHTVRVLTFGDAVGGDYPYPVMRVPRRALPRRMADYACAARRESAQADLVFLNSLGLPLGGARRVPRVIKIVGDLAWERAVNRGWIPPTEDIDAFQMRRYDPRVEAVKALRAREVRRVDRVIVPSDYLRRMVIGWGAPPERVQVIYNALEPDAQAASLDQAEARAALDLGPGPLLLAPARLTAWKGIDHLLRALAQIPDARLLVAGDGPEDVALRGLAASVGVGARVMFLGRVPRERLGLLFRAADYTVLYSGYEGLSHTLLESLLAGTPVIASDKGGNPEVVRHEVNGLLVAYGDPDTLAAAIRAALAGDTRARLAGGTGAGLDRFAWGTLVERTVALLEAAALEGRR